MRRDLVIARLVSALVHSAVALSFGKKNPPPLAPPPPSTFIEISLPPPEPEETVSATAAPEQTTTEPAAPLPTHPDILSVNLDTPFVQPIYFSPHPDLGRPSGLITIPADPLDNGTGTGLGNIFSLADLDENPRTFTDGAFNSSYEMRRDGLTGEVEVGFVIDEKGQPHDPYIIRSSHRELEAPALAAVRGSRFMPGKKGGRAVSTRVTRVFVIKPLDVP